MPPPTPKTPAKPEAPLPPCQPDRYVEVGQIVLYYPDLAAEARAAPALVTAIGMDAIDLLVFHPGLSGGWPQQGVYHRRYQAEKAGGEGGYWMPRMPDVAALHLAIAQGLVQWDGDSGVYKPKPPAPPTAPKS